MKKLILLVIISFLAFSCGNDKKDKKVKEEDNNKLDEVKEFDDSDYVLSDLYPVGDVRRYGIFPDSTHASGHPFTKKTRIETVLDLAETNNIEITFPEGYYKLALVIRGRKNLNMTFNKAQFGGMIQIYEQDSIESKNINIKGDLITYAGVFIRNASNINLNDLTIKTDISKNIYKLRSKGCHLNIGAKKITINNLLVEDLGSGNTNYKNVKGGLIIDGWNNNPEQVKINKVHIKSSDRHGVYLTGKEHQINEIIIDRFGVGTLDDMATMSDMTSKNDYKNFTGLWVNKCYDSFINKVTINTANSKGKYAANFENGKAEMPVEIREFKVLNKKTSLIVKGADSEFMTIGVQE